MGKCIEMLPMGRQLKKATPEQLLQIVSTLPSATVRAPRGPLGGTLIGGLHLFALAGPGSRVSLDSVSGRKHGVSK